MKVTNLPRFGQIYKNILLELGFRFGLVLGFELGLGFGNMVIVRVLVRCLAMVLE